MKSIKLLTIKITKISSGISMKKISQKIYTIVINPRKIKKKKAILGNARRKISKPAYPINKNTTPIESSKIGYLQGIFVLQCLHFPHCKRNENTGISSLVPSICLQCGHALRPIKIPSSLFFQRLIKTLEKLPKRSPKINKLLYKNVNSISQRKVESEKRFDFSIISLW